MSSHTECIDRLIRYCIKMHRKRGWGIFNDHNISFQSVRLLEDFEREANLPLPPSLACENGSVNSDGIRRDKELHRWSEVSCVLIKSDSYPANYHEMTRVRTDKYLVFSTQEGTIYEVRFQHPDHHRNLLGHFIEHYRMGKR